MKALRAIVIAVIVLVVLWLAVAVILDARTELPACETLAGSVCVPETVCPTGYVMHERHPCAIEAFRCCIPG